jgi:phosphatidylglycerol:prolipoprotein diacylglycerol transferase
MLPFFTLFGKTIGLYQVMALCGVFAAGIYACYPCKKKGRDDNEAIQFLLFVSIGVLLGSHILYAVVNYHEAERFSFAVQNNGTFKDYLDAFIALAGGSVFYGGLLGGLLAGFIYLSKKQDRTYLIDIVSPAIPLFHFFGRRGCFLGGCCFGIESKAGFVFRNSPIEEANGLLRFPVQLLEAAFNLMLFIALDTLRRKRPFEGKLLYLYLISYSLGRFFIEFLRGDSYRGIWVFLSTSQLISIALFCFSFFALLGGKTLYHRTLE